MTGDLGGSCPRRTASAAATARSATSAGPGESGSVTLEISLDDFGVYETQSLLDCRVGLNQLIEPSNVAQRETASRPPTRPTRARR